MSIRSRLVVIFSFVLSVLLALGFYAASMDRHNRAETDEVWMHTRGELTMAYRAKVAFDSQKLAWANLIVRGHEPAKYYEYLSAFYARERETRDAIDKVLSVYSKEARHHHESSRDHLESARKFQEVYRALGRQYREALKVYNASEEPVFEADRYLGEAVENPSSLINEMIEQIIDHHRTEIKGMNASADAQLTRLWIGAALVLLLAMAVLVWFTYYRIGRPLSIITSVAQQIRDGDIERRVPRQSGDEFGVLAETLNDMLDRLESASRSLTGKVKELEKEIDHRRTIEAALAAKTDELRDTNGELEAFSYTIAHDLRSPLRAITGFSQMLQEDLRGNIEPEHQDALDRVSAAGLRMADQIDHILELTRINRNELALEDVDLSKLAGEVVSELRSSEPGRQVAIDIQPDMHARADAGLLRIVLQNLLGNAWKYTQKEARPSIRLSAGEENGQTVYRVSDNGVGFDMDYSDKLFGVFQRLHSVDEFEGVGIGLASTRRAIRRHRGWIRGQAEPGKGAEFVFSLG